MSNINCGEHRPSPLSFGQCENCGYREESHPVTAKYPALSVPDQREAIRMLDALEGSGPGGRSNHAYADGHYARFIEDKFNMTFSTLNKVLGR